MKSAASTLAFISLASFLVFSSPTPGSASELDFEDILAEPKTYSFPEIRPEIRMGVGYTFFDLGGSNQVGEYEYLHNSLSVEGVLRYFDYPHRIHLDIHERNEKDYSGDIWYTYKENFLIRLTSRSLYHQLGNLSLVDPNPATPSPSVKVEDSGREYAIRAGDNRGFIRLTAPDYPAHLYIDYSQIQRDGVIQQRSMGGSGYFSSQVRRSQARDLDLETTMVTVGANSHLGPIEIGYSHSEKRLAVGGQEVLYDKYTAASSIRKPGEWPHNRISETSGGTDTLKLHTAYSGRIVATATFSKSDRANDDSNAYSDSLLGAGNLTLLFSDRWSFCLSYRYLDTDIDNPESVTVADKSKPTNTYGDKQVRPSISTLTKTGSLALRYKPFPSFSLKTQYTYEDVEREDEERWELPKSTRRETLTLAATQRIGKNVKLDATYVNQAVRDPAYNVEPHSSNEGRFSLSWLILETINTSLSYQIRQENRDELHYLSDTGALISDAKNRDVLRQMFFGTATCPIRKNVSLTANFAYLHNRIEQDIAYNYLPPGGVSAPRVDAGAPTSEDRAYSYALGLSYQPTKKINLDASLSRITGKGDFSTNSDDLNLPVAIGSFSVLETSETDVTLSGKYAFTERFSAGLHYQYRNFDDTLNNPNDDLEDGWLHAVFLTLNNKW